MSFSLFAARHGYFSLVIDAVKDSAVTKGRYSGGSIVLIKKALPLQGIVTERCEWGEHISFVLHNTVKFHCVYRYPSTSM